MTKAVKSFLNDLKKTKSYRLQAAATEPKRMTARHSKPRLCWLWLAFFSEEGGQNTGYSIAWPAGGWLNCLKLP